MKPTQPQREMPHGTERQCKTCRGWWPLDDEFFIRGGTARNYLSADCRACKAEARMPKREAA